MAQRRRLFEMRLDEPIDGIRMSAIALSDEEILRWVKGTVDGWTKSSGLFPFPMRPSRRYITLVSHTLLRPLRPSCYLYFPIPLLRLPAGDEGCASLPAARSRGRKAVGGESGAR